MERLLKKRDALAHDVIQMCDALSRNLPASFKTILCNYLSHGFRKFIDLKDFYPNQCIHVIELIAKIYKHDEETFHMTKLEILCKLIKTKLLKSLSAGCRGIIKIRFQLCH